MQPSVLIVILNYATYDLTLKIIESIHTILDYENYSIMVIDNCSPNESARVLEEYSEKLNYIFYPNRINSGYAAGNNIGIRYAIKNNFTYSWILNNDVDLREKNILKSLVEVLENNNKIGCVGPKIYNADGTICGPYCRRPSLWNMTIGIFEDKKYRNSQIEISNFVYRVYGCCMLLNNAAMKNIDCMDERTFLYGEEQILSERLIRKGYETYYNADVSVTHLGSETMKRISGDQKKMLIIEEEKSRELYLKEYRNFSFLERWICHFVRHIIIRMK